MASSKGTSMGWIWYSGCSRFDGALVDDGDDGTEGEPGAEVSFGEVAMEKQSVWNDFVNL